MWWCLHWYGVGDGFAGFMAWEVPQLPHNATLFKRNFLSALHKLLYQGPSLAPIIRNLLQSLYVSLHTCPVWRIPTESGAAFFSSYPIINVSTEDLLFMAFVRLVYLGIPSFWNRLLLLYLIYIASMRDWRTTTSGRVSQQMLSWNFPASWRRNCCFHRIPKFNRIRWSVFRHSLPFWVLVTRYRPRCTPTLIQSTST